METQALVMVWQGSRGWLAGVALRLGTSGSHKEKPGSKPSAELNIVTLIDTPLEIRP